MLINVLVYVMYCVCKGCIVNLYVNITWKPKTGRGGTTAQYVYIKYPISKPYSTIQPYNLDNIQPVTKTI